MANELPNEIRALIESHIDGFNTQNDERFIKLFDEGATIVDGIAPYRWISPDAPAQWLAECVRWREKFDVSHESLSYEMSFWMVEGSHAYAVVSGTLTVIMKGQTVARTGLLTYTFSKGEDGWKIGAQAWGRTS